eukprot:scaffold8382_cov70-Phaeocystis_antarctica.AAC.1
MPLPSPRPTRSLPLPAPARHSQLRKQGTEQRIRDRLISQGALPAHCAARTMRVPLSQDTAVIVNGVSRGICPTGHDRRCVD